MPTETSGTTEGAFYRLSVGFSTVRQQTPYVAFPGLTPRVEIDGTIWIVRVQELAALPGAELREPVASLAAERDALKRALDILIDGI